MRVRPRFIPVRTGNGREVTVTGAAVAGLSPCVRGTVRWQSSFLFTGRFIPVRTGNGLVSPVKSFHWSVYPRAYGERLS